MGCCGSNQSVQVKQTIQPKPELLLHDKAYITDQYGKGYQLNLPESFQEFMQILADMLNTRVDLIGVFWNDDEDVRPIQDQQAYDFSRKRKQANSLGYLVEIRQNNYNIKNDASISFSNETTFFNQVAYEQPVFTQESKDFSVNLGVYTAKVWQNFIQLYNITAQKFERFNNSNLELTSRILIFEKHKIFITGGIVNAFQAYEFDIDTNKLTKHKDMIYGRSSHAMLYADNFVLCIGGQGTTRILRECEIWDGQRWQVFATLNNQRKNHSATVFNKTVYVFGGSQESSIEAWNGGGEWRLIQYRLPIQLSRIGIATLSTGELLLIGGSKDKQVKSAWLMNIQSGQFEDFADMLVEDMFDSNGVSCNGGIYFMGTKGMHIWRNEWSFVAYK